MVLPVPRARRAAPLALLAAAALAAGAAPPADDALAALQTSAEVSTNLANEAFAHWRLRDLLQRAAQEGARGASSSGPQAEAIGRQRKVDCGATPEMCREPFNCHLPAPENKSVARADGHPDYRSWCGGPYQEAILQCVKGDLEGYSQLMRKAQLALPMASMLETLDSHYCFSMGHCNDTQVTPTTTAAEAEAMCDSRFGKGWRKISRAALGITVKGMRPGHFGPYFDEKNEKSFAELACATGNYHCEVMYCRLEYCKKPAYAFSYKHNAIP